MSKNKSASLGIWLYQLYKWPVYVPLMLVNAIVCATLAALFAILVSPRAGSFWGMMWAKITCWFTPVFVKVHGRENFVKGQSYVVVANHQSGFDIFLLYAHLGVDFKWVMKKELRKVPFIGYASEKVGHIFIDRSSPRAAIQSLEEAQRKLAGGASVVMFPEGTRSGKETMRPFKRGAFKLARELKLPVLPVTIVNSWRIKRKGFLNIVPGRVGLVIHSPIDTCNYDNETERLVKTARDAIQSGNKVEYTRNSWKKKRVERVGR